MEMQKGQTSLDEQDKQLAAEALTRGRRHSQQAVEALKRGQRDLAYKDLDRAIDEYTEVIRIDPDHPAAYMDRARVYEQKGEDDKAEADLEKARQLEA